MALVLLGLVAMAVWVHGNPMSSLWEWPRQHAHAASHIAALIGLAIFLRLSPLRACGSRMVAFTSRCICHLNVSMARGCAWTSKQFHSIRSLILLQILRVYTCFVPPQPHEWGLRVSDLSEFRDDVIHDLRRYCKGHKVIFREGICIHVCLNEPCDDCKDNHRGAQVISKMDVYSHENPREMLPNMHLVVSREIRWQTKRRRCSYALHKHVCGLSIDTFVSHCWSENFDDFVRTLEMALEPSDVVWVCSFALPQHGAVGGLLADDDLAKVPFAKALTKAKKMLIALDQSLEVPTRAWCVFELHMARKRGIPTVPWLSHLEALQLASLQADIQSISTRDCGASKEEDERKIKDHIKCGEGFEVLDNFLQTFLLDKINFYKAAAKTLGEPTTELQQHQRNAAMREQLLEASRSESRRLQEAFEHQSQQIDELEAKLSAADARAEGQIILQKQRLQRVRRQSANAFKAMMADLDSERSMRGELEVTVERLQLAVWRRTFWIWCVVVMAFLAVSYLCWLFEAAAEQVRQLEQQLVHERRWAEAQVDTCEAPLEPLPSCAAGTSASDDPVSFRDSPLLTRLHMATSRGDNDMVDQILDSNPEAASLRSGDGRGLAWWGFEFANAHALASIYACGGCIDVLAKDVTGRTALAVCDEKPDCSKEQITQTLNKVVEDVKRRRAARQPKSEQ